ncbi:hypothetical protein HOE22_01115 [Candidatus Woesearchaeota archaeon]|jgi:hypothetical protein|nr:hypothetical protein [Candidatus Woesearchaeota archaeon]
MINNLKKCIGDEMKALELLLEKNKTKLSGDWVSSNTNYEDDFCKILGMDTDTKRYWDVKWEDKFIELKKGNSRWLDLVRYSEIFFKVNEDASKKTITLFLIPNKDKNIIKEIICVDTDKILKYYKLTKEKAKWLIELKADIPGSFNAQASLGITDLRQMANFIIKN